MTKLGSLIAALLLLAAAPAWAQPDQPDVLPKEFTCMSAQTKYASKFWLAKNKCVSKCLYYYWRGIDPNLGNCMPPYGGITATCVADPLKGAEVKLETALVKACVTGPGADCPECYTQGCGVSPYQDVVQQQEGQFDSFVPGLFCETTGATPDEQKCQLNTAKIVTKYFDLRNRCYTKCFVDQRSGGDPALCLPPATAPKAVACLQTTHDKAVLALDSYCNETLRPGVQPDCGGGYPSGASWAGLIDTVVDGAIAPTFCASPSGAFVD